LSLSSATSLSAHFIPPRSISLLSTYLRLVLPSGLPRSGFPNNNIHAIRFSTIRATCPAHLKSLDFVTIVTKLLIMQFSNQCNILYVIFVVQSFLLVTLYRLSVLLFSVY
jgi:hypothetical protein